MNTYRIIYTERVGKTEVGKSTLMTAHGVVRAEVKFNNRHKNCRVLSIK